MVKLCTVKEPSSVAYKQRTAALEAVDPDFW